MASNQRDFKLKTKGKFHRKILACKVEITSLCTHTHRANLKFVQNDLSLSFIQFIHNCRNKQKCDSAQI